MPHSGAQKGQDQRWAHKSDPSRAVIDRVTQSSRNSVQSGSVLFSWARVFQLLPYSFKCPITPQSWTMQHLRSSKITAYFPNMETEKRRAADSGTNGSKVIWVNWVTFFDWACNSCLHHIVLIYNMSIVYFLQFYKLVLCNKGNTCLNGTPV